MSLDMNWPLSILYGICYANSAQQLLAMIYERIKRDNVSKRQSRSVYENGILIWVKHQGKLLSESQENMYQNVKVDLCRRMEMSFKDQFFPSHSNGCISLDLKDKEL